MDGPSASPPLLPALKPWRMRPAAHLSSSQRWWHAVQAWCIPPQGTVCTAAAGRTCCRQRKRCRRRRPRTRCHHFQGDSVLRSQIGVDSCSAQPKCTASMPFWYKQGPPSCRTSLIHQQVPDERFRGTRSVRARFVQGVAAVMHRIARPLLTASNTQCTHPRHSRWQNAPDAASTH